MSVDGEHLSLKTRFSQTVDESVPRGRHTYASITDQIGDIVLKRPSIFNGQVKLVSSGKTPVRY